MLTAEAGMTQAAVSGTASFVVGRLSVLFSLQIVEHKSLIFFYCLGNLPVAH